MNPGLSLLPNCYMDDQGRDRCDEDGKVPFRTETQAAATIEKLWRSGQLAGRAMSTYQGNCGYWHLTSGKTS